MQSYDYANRKGVIRIRWERFAQLAGKLAEALEQEQVNLVVGLARAGLFPATQVACALRCELYPARLTRRLEDQVTYQHPIWKVDISPQVQGRIVTVVDEIADTGETLALAAERARQLGALRVVTAVLVAHSWANPAPDHAALTSDALVIFPWDQRVRVNGSWQLHPEISDALRQQGIDHL